MTAITASIAPRSQAAGGVALFGIHQEALSAELDVWTLASANNGPPS